MAGNSGYNPDIVYINARNGKHAHSSGTFPATVRALYPHSLFVVLYRYAGGEVAYFLQRRLYLHQIVDVEPQCLRILLPHPAGNENRLMQCFLGLFQCSLYIVHRVPVTSCGHTSGTLFRRIVALSVHVTMPLARYEKGVLPAYSGNTHLSDRYEKGRRRHLSERRACRYLCISGRVFCSGSDVMPPFSRLRVRAFPPSRSWQSWQSWRTFRPFQVPQGSGQSSWHHGLPLPPHG